MLRGVSHPVVIMFYAVFQVLLCHDIVQSAYVMIWDFKYFLSLVHFMKKCNISL
jgi:hypothetical protein